MNTNINSTLRLALLFCYLFILSEQALGQAFVMGKYPAYTPVNLNIKKSLDKVALEVRYRFTWTYDGEITTHSEQRTLLVGSNHNYSRNEVLYQNDSIATSLLSKGAKGVPLYSNPIVAYEVWTNLTSNIVEVGYRTPYDNMVISFSMPGNELKWKFSDDAKQKILGYACSKATTTYRGRNVTAWFAEELPYNAGPYCFFGLPGLVMKVEYGKESWEAIGLRKGCVDEQIYEYARPVQNISRKESISFLIGIYNDPVATYSSLGVECSSIDNPDKILLPGSLKWDIPTLLKMEQ